MISTTGVIIAPSSPAPPEWSGQPARHGTPPGLRVSLLELGSLPTAVPCARLHARNVFTEWRLPRDMIADAELLVSELISNAIAATSSLPEPQPVALRLYANDERLMIEAWDRHPGVPLQRPAAPDDEGGRGLSVIEAYSDRWGCLRANDHLKAVWCELLMRGPGSPVLHMP